MENSKLLKQALIITAYKNFEQLYEYLTLYTEHFYCYVHIDKKAKAESELYEKICHLPHVRVISVYSIKWGSYRHIMAILELMRMAVAEHPDLTYLHMISGDDMMIKPAEYFELFFEENKGKNYLELKPADNENERKKSRYFYFMHLFNYKKRIRLIPRALKLLQQICHVNRHLEYEYKGLIWCSITREAAEYVIHTVECTEVMKNLKYCFVPEEFFFQNILAASELKDTLVNNYLRYDVWDKPGRANPAVLDMRDYEKLRQSDALFARKVDIRQSGELYQHIREDLGMGSTLI